MHCTLLSWTRFSSDYISSSWSTESTCQYSLQAPGLYRKVERWDKGRARWWLGAGWSAGVTYLALETHLPINSQSLLRSSREKVRDMKSNFCRFFFMNIPSKSTKFSYMPHNYRFPGTCILKPSWMAATVINELQTLENALSQ